jgi:hypothetical protein
VVNDNFAYGRTRVDLEPPGPLPEIVSQPRWGALGVGSEVVHHFADPAARLAHPPGLILEVQADAALVRWAPGDRTPWCPLVNLVKR